ncbi:hypothetical protein [Bacillus sp. S/N-304-OC-R1]|uniref:hypothetical protein n=1 Tax=Bacillus sp. S/N-304-OC-R1 TaxID=2758034 RepID=UPI001C8D60A2|nr:hypothetical protein [Bacillus sp. S/N-304-OC-R1]MBY0122198.1 hypothetical protein [Bacillus sp. S/N-304-OC-R1]
MSRQAVYYEEIDGQQYPYWFVINVEDGEINWEKETFYFEVKAPFERFSIFDFDEYQMGVSIGSTDIVRSNTQASILGVTLKNIKKRIIENDGDPNNVRQLIILMSDIEESLSLFNKNGNF